MKQALATVCSHTVAILGAYPYDPGFLTVADRCELNTALKMGLCSTMLRIERWALPTLQKSTHGEGYHIPGYVVFF